MNSLEGHISVIEVSGGLSLVTIKVTEQLSLKAIVIETPETASYLEVGRKIRLMFKETEVIIGTREAHRISLQNRIDGTIKAIESGQLLSRLIISTEAGTVTSVISSDSVSRLGLHETMGVCAMIKLNEMMLSE